jgi:hypothetical protein
MMRASNRIRALARLSPMAALVASLAAGTANAAAASVFDGPWSSLPRMQVGYHDNGDFRASASFYGASADGAFVLGAADYNFNVRQHSLDTTRLQLFAGAPFFHSDRTSVFGWVIRGDLVDIGSMNRTRGGVPGMLADVRSGIQVTAQHVPLLSPWFTRHRAELFVEVFPVRTSDDFGNVDLFIRFSKRFTPRLVLRGVLRIYCFDRATVVAVENDFIYQVNKRIDVFARVGKANHDWPGLAQKRTLYGGGVRFGF